MTLPIKPSTSLERKLLFIETLLNTTDKVSKVSPNSVNSGVAGGVAKLAGKAEKDIILALSQLFPDLATGSQLDQVAINFGVSGRFSASGSSVYVLLTGDPGTTYVQATHILQSTEGVQFEFEEVSVTIPAFGWTYAKVRSLTSGLDTNVSPLTITKLTTTPIGHTYVINEVRAFGGRDIEQDNLFRQRIKNGANILARGTLGMLEQLFMSINEKVLKCFYQGINSVGKVRIVVATQNGANLSSPELDELLLGASKYFSFTDYRPFGTQFLGVELLNVTYEPIDVSFRLDYDVSYNLDEIRKQIQVNISKYLDFRFFDTSRQQVEWDNMLQIVKNVPGVKYVPDQHFTPRTDTTIPIHKLPRLRGFRMLDMSGSIIQDFSGVLSPVYYPPNPDFSYQRTVLGQ